MRETQRKGDIALAKAISTFTEMEYDVSIPITESAAYDLIVDGGTGLWRVQVKYCTGKQVDLRRVHTNAKGYVVKKYEEKSYDWLYVYSPNNGEYLIMSCHIGSTINLKDEYKLYE